MNGDNDLERLEQLLDHRFVRRELLRRALTHSSHAQDAPESQNATSGLNNERLEFLGDAVLGFLVSEALIARFPEMREGQLAKIKSNLVSARRLHRIAQSLELGAYLTLGRGEEKTGGRTKPALLADAVEAVLAALYLDGGLEAARRFTERFLLAELGSGPVEELLLVDHKSALQEHLQATQQVAVEYVIVAQAGPEHQKIFTVEVRVAGRPLTRASASTKKTAEQEAARQALALLQREGQTVS